MSVLRIQIKRRIRELFRIIFYWAFEDVWKKEYLEIYTLWPTQIWDQNKYSEIYLSLT